MHYNVSDNDIRTSGNSVYNSISTERDLHQCGRCQAKFFELFDYIEHKRNNCQHAKNSYCQQSNHMYNYPDNFHQNEQVGPTYNYHNVNYNKQLNSQQPSHQKNYPSSDAHHHNNCHDSFTYQHNDYQSYHHDPKGTSFLCNYGSNNQPNNSTGFHQTTTNYTNNFEQPNTYQYDIQPIVNSVKNTHNVTSIPSNGHVDQNNMGNFNISVGCKYKSKQLNSSHSGLHNYGYCDKTDPRVAPQYSYNQEFQQPTTYQQENPNKIYNYQENHHPPHYNEYSHPPKNVFYPLNNYNTATDENPSVFLSNYGCSGGSNEDDVNNNEFTSSYWTEETSFTQPTTNFANEHNKMDKNANKISLKSTSSAPPKQTTVDSLNILSDDFIPEGQTFSLLSLLENRDTDFESEYLNGGSFALPPMNDEDDGHEDNSDYLTTKNKQSVFRCDHCEKVFRKKSNLSTHLRSHTGERPFQCILCGKLSSQKSHLKRHMETHKVWLKSKIQKTVCTATRRSQKSQLTYYCQYCNAEFDSYMKRRNHLATVHKDKQVYKCLLAKCNELTFEKVDDFISHLVDDHLPTEFGPYTCARCDADEKFATLEDMKAHYNQAHSAEEQTTPYSNDSKRSKSTHSVPKKKKRLSIKESFKCELCFKVFSSKIDLDQHKMSVSHRHACDSCKKCFASEKLLKKHLLTHQNSQLFNCSTCGKQLKSKTSLLTHMKTHADEKHECSECDAKFCRKDLLKRHMLKHDGVVIKCDFENCPYTTTRKDKLKEHMKVHQKKNSQEEEQDNLCFLAL